MEIGADRNELTRYAALWLASRLLVVCVAYAAVFQVHDSALDTSRRLVEVLAHRWDASFYLRIAEHGYPSLLPSTDRLTHDWAFYPLYSWVAGILGRMAGNHFALAALAFNAVTGVLGALLFGVWLRKRLDEKQTLWAVAFFSFWTQSYFLTYAYAEPLYFVLLCLSLLLLDSGGSPLGWQVAVAFPLGLAMGLCRPYAVVVAVAVFASALWQLPRRAFFSNALGSRALWASTLYGVGTAVSLVFVWYGNCWLHTGVWTNCVVKAWEIGWGYNSSTLPQALVREVRALIHIRPFEYWHLVKAWELSAWALAVAMLIASYRLIPKFGVMPMALALLPLVTNTTFIDITSVPRYMATTPTVFLLLSQVHAKPVVRALVMGGVLALHLMSSVATARAVWQSF